jgi:hypothetical protein
MEAPMPSLPVFVARRRFMSAIALGVAVALAGAVTAQSGAAPPANPPDTSPKAVVAAASRYLEEYTTKLAYVVADETYMQETFASEGVRTASRLMKGELFLTFLKADRAWIAVHDVAEVDGEPVPDRQALQMLIARGATSSVVAEVARQNARWNLGRIERNFNEPTLALMVLDKERAGNFNFARKAVETVDGVTLVTLTFTERGRPTIVSSRSRRPPVACAPRTSHSRTASSRPN